jgi:hypothetical protein
MLKKSLSIALLSFFLLHLAGFYVYFGIRQAQIHREMRSKLKYLPANQLEVIHLSTKAYHHALRDDGDEIEVNGKMFDIARVEIKQNQVIIYCLHDSAEDNLLSFLDQVLKNVNHDSQQPSPSLFQFNFLSFILPSDLRVENSTPLLLCPFTSYLIGETCFVLSLDTPPPRV